MASRWIASELPNGRYCVKTVGIDTNAVGSPVLWRGVTFSSYSTCVQAIEAIDAGCVDPVEWLKQQPALRKTVRVP